jgi:hypothetical protein
MNKEVFQGFGLIALAVVIGIVVGVSYHRWQRPAPGDALVSVLGDIQGKGTFSFGFDPMSDEQCRWLIRSSVSLHNTTTYMEKQIGVPVTLRCGTL